MVDFNPRIYSAKRNCSPYRNYASICFVENHPYFETETFTYRLSLAVMTLKPIWTGFFSTLTGREGGTNWPIVITPAFQVKLGSNIIWVRFDSY